MSPDNSIRIPKEILNELLAQNPEKAETLLASGTADDAGNLVTKFQHLNEYHVTPLKLDEFGGFITAEPLLTFSF
jgi:hypothetical protein